MTAPLRASLPGLDRATRRTPSLAHALARAATRDPDEVGVVHGELRWSWRELDARVDALAAALQDRGVEPGQVVLTHSPNTADLLTVMYACWRIGAVWAPTNFRIDPHDVAVIADTVRPHLLICHESLPEHAAALAPLPTLVLRDPPAYPARPDSDEPAPFGQAYVDTLVSGYAGSRPREHRPRADDPVWLFFTSGSSGRPKAAVLTAEQMQFVVTNHLADLMPDLRHTDGTLVVAPLSHGAGIHVLMHVARGARVVLMPTTGLDVATAWDLVAAEGISTMFTVPTILARLTRHPQAPAPGTSSLRYVIYAGAPITAKDQRLALEAIGPVIVQYYGLGEVTGNITVLPTWRHDEQPSAEGLTCAGYERTGMQVSIQDDEGRDVPPGERGEICVAGPAVFAGYLHNPEANAKAFRDGWFRTGDLGYLDERGMLYITGRDSDMYISGGSNIDPREVEEKVLSHPDISQAAVVGVPDPQWGEVGYAVLVLRAGADPQACTEGHLVAWFREHLPSYKAPKRAIVVDELPTSGYGKVTKNLLRDALKERGNWPAA